MSGEMVTRERVEAAIRMLLDSGDITPMAARILRSLFGEGS